MRKFIAIIAVLLLVITSSIAAETNSTFSQEFRIDTFGSYNNQNSDFGVGLGVSYFLNKNLGVSGWVTKENPTELEGNLIDSASAVAIFRLPLTSVLAPYVAGGASYNLGTENFSGLLGVGAQYNITKKFGLFAEGDWLFEKFERLPEIGDVSVRAGFRFGF